MAIDMYDARLNNCENNVKLFGKQLNDVADQLKEIAKKVQEIDKIIFEITLLNKLNKEEIDKMNHRLKNTDAAVSMLQEQHTIIETQHQAKINLFKTWQVWLTIAMGFVGIFGALMSVYDRFTQNIVR